MHLNFRFQRAHARFDVLPQCFKRFRVQNGGYCDRLAVERKRSAEGFGNDELIPAFQSPKRRAGERHRQQIRAGFLGNRQRAGFENLARAFRAVRHDGADAAVLKLANHGDHGAAAAARARTAHGGVANAVQRLRNHFAVIMFAHHAADIFAAVNENRNENFAVPGADDERALVRAQCFEMISSEKTDACPAPDEQQQEPAETRREPEHQAFSARQPRRRRRVIDDHVSCIVLLKISLQKIRNLRTIGHENLNRGGKSTARVTANESGAIVKRIYFILPLCLSLLMCSPQHKNEADNAVQKLDPRLRMVLQRPEQTAADTPLEVLIKFKAPLTPEQQAQLANAGVNVQTTLGTIATATLARAAVLPAAKLDFVVYLEYAKEQKIAPDPVP